MHQTVTEQYTCGKNGLKVFGEVFAIGEVIPRAHELRTLPALLKLGRVRLGLIPTEPPAEDLGSAQAVAAKPRARKASKKKAKKKSVKRG